MMRYKVSNSRLVVSLGNILIFYREDGSYGFNPKSGVSFVSLRKLVKEVVEKSITSNGKGYSGDIIIYDPNETELEIFMEVMEEYGIGK
ncbi:MAG: hypothetical protein EOM67_11745 [Spirochaetia bacterium]|nr:hypothetical protein [Spirochaetia bacterium]